MGTIVATAHTSRAITGRGQMHIHTTTTLTQVRRIPMAMATTHRTTALADHTQVAGTHRLGMTPTTHMAGGTT